LKCFGLCRGKSSVLELRRNVPSPPEWLRPRHPSACTTNSSPGRLQLEWQSSVCVTYKAFSTARADRAPANACSCAAVHASAEPRGPCSHQLAKPRKGKLTGRRCWPAAQPAQHSASASNQQEARLYRRAVERCSGRGICQVLLGYASSPHPRSICAAGSSRLR
jgi:hypothetical protein